ncbi:aldo/keto reductase [Spirosoma linguale]|uniref:Aldo/keto reductase n=1 Tax=Spirosoma linguale (strain ATCC 33905 / DSM 74 / LMG 10896 / Claus 1) TaxID=504472 RepID=D2QLQ7_SPILD|nr:aldo/keto reductase [Spirosoma linguale DSM 74]
MITLDQLSPLGIGTSRAASLGSRLATHDFVDFLRIASERGINLIDTADFYGSGDAERLISQGVRATGLPFFVVTKAGLPRVHTPGWLSPLNQIGKKIIQRAGAKKNYTSGYLIDSVRKSNKRLRVDAADALLLHEPDWADIADADSWDGLAQIQQQGLARYTGVSTNDYRVVEEGIRSGQVQLVQTSACWQENGTSSILALCRAHQIPVIANQTLRPFQSLKEPFSTSADTIRQLDGLAEMSLPQFLIASVLAEKKADSVLFGTSDPTHLRHNINALRYVEPLRPHLSRLNQLLS